MDILIQGSTLLDAVQESQKVKDVLIRDGRIFAIEDKISTLSVPDGTEVINGTGKFLSAGWIDAHLHRYTGGDGMGISVNDALENGVTYAVDAGTAGPKNFETFLKQDLLDSQLPGKAYLNIAPFGLLAEKGELTDLTKVDLNACEEVCHNFDQFVLGFKLRIDPRVCSDPVEALRLARTLSDKVGKPFAVHPSRCEISLETVLSFMKKGDMYAHTYADKAPGLLDENGQVKKAAWEARERGVQFDLSHGNANFSFDIAKRAFAQGFVPDAVSTDLHARSASKVKNLPLTMSKAMACGLDLMQMIRKVTSDAARMLQIQDKQTSIRVGEKADLVLFSVNSGTFDLTDSDGKQITGKKLIVPLMTVLGKMVFRKN